MENKYTTYIGSYENVIGRYVYVKFPTGFVGGKVVEFVFPKHGIGGTYKVKRDDGNIMSTKIIYLKIE